MKVVLLNTIQTTAMMTKVQERLDDLMTWQDARNAIITLDRAKALTGDYMGSGSRNTADAAQVKNKNVHCRVCSRKSYKRIVRHPKINYIVPSVELIVVMSPEPVTKRENLRKRTRHHPRIPQKLSGQKEAFQMRGRKNCQMTEKVHQ